MALWAVGFGTCHLPSVAAATFGMAGTRVATAPLSKINQELVSSVSLEP
jgi:hypothetical protein